FGEPGIREKITEAVVQKFTTDNTLKIADRKISDTILEGSIVNVRDDPSTITGAEKVNTRRITISVKVTFQDLRTRKVIWEKNFSNWGDYDASSFANRQIGFKTAIDKLTEDILIGTVSDW
ncbi:MAG: LPS assembly lipoprotein LptE, partial [Ignavibacteria bacterium]|nr:LPS assembly lipoprotein LptE [Ignavibacteria bacterium]